MIIYIIPSWFPSKTNEITGSFIKEQAEAIAQLNSDLTIVVSLWGHEDSFISPRKLFSIPKQLWWRLRQARNVIEKHNGVFYVFNPALHWSHRIPFGGVRNLIEVNRVNFLLAKKKFGEIDLIHAHVSYPGGYIASQLAKEFSVPYVITEHMGPFPFKSMLKNGRVLPEISYALEHASEIISVSPAAADDIAAYGFKQPLVVPNLIDERHFKLRPSKQSKKLIFFTLCRITKGKGLDILLDAISLWNPPSDKFEFWIGGDGSEIGNLKIKSDKLGLSDRVFWLGNVTREQAPEIFSNCSIFILPSRYESFGIVYAEALASGKPIIATRCGGPESFANKDNGLLVEKDNVYELSQAMQKLVSNINHYKPDVIRINFLKLFSRTPVVKSLFEIYKKIIDAHLHS